MANIIINGKPQMVDCPIALTQILKQFNVTPGAFAIAINETFIPREKYASAWLHSGDRLEIVSPLQGG
jgi:sulfur carrier protein